MGKTKNDNNLFMLTINGHEKQYFTSANRVANYVGKQAPLVLYNIARNKQMTDEEGNTYDIETVDGSDIPYRLINNNRE